MSGSSKTIWPWVAALFIVGTGIFFGLAKPNTGNDLKTDKFKLNDPPVVPVNSVRNQSADDPAIVAQNAPVVTGFTGDLADGGTKDNDGHVTPFVIGDNITLSAQATNAIEYCWKVDGKVIKDKDREWSVRKDREFEIPRGGEIHVSVQVRGTDLKSVSLPKEAILKTATVFIKGFEAFLTENPDRALTGDDYTVQLDLAEPLGVEPDYYRIRYLVNDVPIKHPDDGLEWTTERDLTYTFPAPGRYSFKVEVRRATEKEPEDSRTLAETITVADSIVLTFDTAPEKFSSVGTSVDFNVFNMSLFGKSDCRFGVKKIVAADFDWLPDKSNMIWGDSERTWLPTEPGNYLIRAEVREVGKDQADDFRELFYTVTDGEF